MSAIRAELALARDGQRLVVRGELQRPPPATRGVKPRAWLAPPPAARGRLPGSGRAERRPCAAAKVSLGRLALLGEVALGGIEFGQASGEAFLRHLRPGRARATCAALVLGRPLQFALEAAARRAAGARRSCCWAAFCAASAASAAARPLPGGSVLEFGEAVLRFEPRRFGPAFRRAR